MPLIPPDMKTINRPLYTYDQFTNNPLKLLAQKILPRKILRKLWKATTYSLMVPNKHLQTISHPLVGVILGRLINHELQTWLTPLLNNIKIWYEPNGIRIEFKYINDAALFRLLWS